MSDCIFCRILAGEIPSQRVYEDEDVVAFRDIHPKAPVHVLVVPRKHIASLDEATEADAALLGRITLVLPRLARELGLTEGFRTIVNTGPGGGQEVFHLHYHILGGPARLPFA
jgi:histidine triad (HIT) family protein